MAGKIVYAYVVADLLHVGHVHALENAKNFAGEGGKLVVGVLTDEATMEKKSRPTIPFGERMRLVKALKCVDLVVPQETYSPIPNVKIIKPNVLMESNSHTEEDLRETYQICEKITCDVVIMPYYPEQSSTKIKENVKNNFNPSNKVKEGSSYEFE